MSDQNDVNANFAEDANNDSNGSCGCSGSAGSSGGKGKMIAFVLVMLLALGVAAYSIMGKDKTIASTGGSCPENATACQGAVCSVEKGVAAEKDCSVKASASYCPGSVDQVGEKEQK